MKSRASALYFTSFPKLYKGCVSENKLPDLHLSENKLPDLHIFYIPFSKENYKLYIRGYSPLFPNLITKESYDRWVTRRVWGFRHQISKAKYLKMSIAHIGKRQENTAALCRKISQNVSRTYREASGEHRGTVQNGCETLRVSAIRRSGYV